jgi:excisionase family DNA binding protein
MHRQEKSSQRRPATFETPLLVSVPEAARLLGIGSTLGWEMVRSGEMPSVRFGRRVLVPRAALERLATARVQGKPAQDEDGAGIPTHLTSP